MGRHHDRHTVSKAIGHAIARSATRSKLDVGQVRRWWAQLRIVDLRGVQWDELRRNHVSMNNVADGSGRNVLVHSWFGWRGFGR
jgi:hypothetical protein